MVSIFAMHQLIFGTLAYTISGIMRTTIIIASYNKPQYLKLVLDGYRHQSVLNQGLSFDIIIADDGSTDETKQLIEAEKQDYPVSIQHIWHADNGFQKCQILNKAIAACKGSEYLIFTDDDCIPFPDFVESHLKFASAETYLSSGAMRVPQKLTDYIFTNGYKNIQFNFLWLHQHGLPDIMKYKRFHWSYSIRTLLDLFVPVKRTFNGNNTSAFRDDIVKVGGFDERMQYYGEDVELGLRLSHSGVKAKRVRHRARALHLEHGRAYVTEEMIVNNKIIIEDTLASKRSYSENHVEF